MPCYSDAAIPKIVRGTKNNGRRPHADAKLDYSRIFHIEDVQRAFLESLATEQDIAPYLP